MTASRALSVFGHFWWDFIIGDTPEVAVGVAGLMIIGWLLARRLPAAAVVVLPLAVVLVLAASLYRGTRTA